MPMIRLTIDQRPIEVSEGTKVIQAAEQLGIAIPRLCYHPALGAVGACRLCAVMFLQGPCKGVQMSCMIACQDGMVVATDHPEALEFRRYVMEWLMLHHPHDCPVCDEGGHCLLQEMTVAGGHGLRRTASAKRTFRDQQLGPLLQHEMNRCIHCYRCVRLYQEYCGGRDFGALGIGNRTWFGRYQAGALESPFSGNLTQFCPTGVFTDKPSRYHGRRWDFERSPSLCLSCSLGCHTTVSARYREVVRLEARTSAEVNGYLLCDRGRHAYAYANLPTRPRQARIDGAPAGCVAAMQEAARRLTAIAGQHGPQAVALASSTRASLETLAALGRLAQDKGWAAPAIFGSAAQAQRASQAVASAEPRRTLSLPELANADAIFLAGTDPIHEAPLLALALRQAWRAGARIAVLDPRPVALPLEINHQPLAPDRLGETLSAILACALDGQQPSGDEALRAFIAQTASALKESRQPVLVCGPELGAVDLPMQMAAAVQRLAASGKDARLLTLLPGANAFGAALVAPAANGWDELLNEIEAGRIKALLVAEADLFWSPFDHQRLRHALAKLELLVVLDYLDSASAAVAHILIPVASLFETGGRFISGEGRLQIAAAAMRGGLPIAQSGGGDHPPRRYDAGLPGADWLAAWQALDLLDADGQRPAAQVHQSLDDWLRHNVPSLAMLPNPAEIPAAGWMVPVGNFPAAPPAAKVPRPVAPTELLILFTDRTFGSDELASYSPQLKALEETPRVWLAEAEAQWRGLTADQRVRLKTAAGGTLEAALALSARMAPGVVMVPRIQRLDWRSLGGATHATLDAA